LGEFHAHDTIIWDDKTWVYVCTTCGLVLEKVPPSSYSQKQLWSEDNGWECDETGNTRLTWKGDGLGSLILEQDLLKLNPQKRELFQRLYRAHLKAVRSFWQDRRKPLFDHFLHRLSEYPAYRTTFLVGHPNTSNLKDTFVKWCRHYAARHGRQMLHNSTKIRIFLVLIQPHLDAKSFRDIVTQVAGTTMGAVYKIRKKLGAWDHSASVNAQRKQDFIEKAKQLVAEAEIDPNMKQLAEAILTKRARVKELIVQKRPAILAAAALFVATQRDTPVRGTKARIQRLLGVSYIPQEAIDECRKLMEMDSGEVGRTEQQEFLQTCLDQRSDLLKSRRVLRRQLAAEINLSLPEFGKVLKLRNKSTLKFLEQYPSMFEIAKLDLDEVITILTTHSRGKLRDSAQLAGRLLSEARKHELIGCRRPRLGNQVVIRSLIKALETVENHRRELERQMRQAIGVEGEVLMRIPGIGLITAVILGLSKGMLAAQAPGTLREPFFQRRLQLALRILQQNRAHRHQYREWLDQKVPSVEVVQQRMVPSFPTHSVPLSSMGL